MDIRVELSSVNLV